MQSLSDDEQRGILGEVLFDKLSVIEEYVHDIPSIKKDVSTLKADVSTLKTDVRTITLAVTDTSKQQWNHEKRIKALETKLG